MSKTLRNKIILVGNALPAAAASFCFLGYGVVTITGFQRILTVTVIVSAVLIGLGFLFTTIRFLRRFGSSSLTLFRPSLQDSLALVLAVIAVIWIWVSALLSSLGQSIGLSYFRKCVFYSLFVAGLFIASRCKSKPTQMWPAYSASAAVLICMVTFIGKIGTIYYGATHNLCLNLSNSNELGMLLCFCFVAISSWLVQLFCAPKRKWWLILIAIAVLLMDLVLLYLSGARGAQLAVVGFVAVFFFLRMFKWKLGVGAASLMAMFPLLFATVYLLVIFLRNGLDLTGALAEGFLNGKSFFTRLDIWIRGLKILETSPIIGNYFIATEGVGLSQLHNISVDVLSAFGVVGYLLITGYLFLVFADLLCKRKQEGVAISFMAASLGCFVLISTFEASVANTPTILAICLPCFIFKDFGDQIAEPLPMAHYSERGRFWNVQNYFE